MNKQAIIDAIASDNEITKKDATSILNNLTATITKAVATGATVELAGFGKFLPALQKGKTGTVPGSTKKYTTSDKMVPKFKAAKAFKDSVAAGK